MYLHVIQFVHFEIFRRFFRFVRPCLVPATYNVNNVNSKRDKLRLMCVYIHCLYGSSSSSFLFKEDPSDSSLILGSKCEITTYLQVISESFITRVDRYLNLKKKKEERNFWIYINRWNNNFQTKVRYRLTFCDPKLTKNNQFVREEI